MRQSLFHCFCVAAGLLLLGIPLSGQSAIASGNDKDKDANQTSPAKTRDAGTHLSYVQDWSTRHLLRPGTRMEDVLASGNRDPRLIYNMLRHQAALKTSSASGVPLRPKEPKKTKIDWAVSLENGYMSPDEFPAKFSFDTGTENCQSDYVLFTLNVNAATITQANLVGINNLYTELLPTPCNSGSPSVAFAYNTQTITGGQIFTSPTLSADGTMVAFIESSTGLPASSYFHVLVLPNPIPTPPGSLAGTVLNPLTPGPCAGGNLANTPGCMTTLTISATDTISYSSPWIDYASDTAYVGDDNGILYKITPVFRGGAPKLVTDADWPVTVSTSILTDPIVDTNPSSESIFLGDLDGYLYSVPLSGPAHAAAATMEIGNAGFAADAGLVDPPIVVTDPANSAVDQVFAFTGCSNLPSFGGAVTQVPADFTSATTTTTMNTVNLTVAAMSNTGNCTATVNFPGNVHSGTFDNNFWVNGSTSGHLIACGFNSGGSIPSRYEPRVYMLPFVSHLITHGTKSFKPDSIAGDECSPLTEFFDGTTDRVFFGVGDAYTGDSTADGFVESATIEATSFLTGTHDCTGTPTPTCVTAPAALGGVSGIVIDNFVTDGGANIYFSTLNPGSVQSGNCSVAGGLLTPYCAVKLTQVDFTQP